MTVLMWRFIQKKTKFIISLSVFYAVLIASCIVLKLLRLKLIISSIVINPNIASMYITSIFMIIVGIILMFYKIKFIIKAMTLVSMLVSMFFLGMLWLRDALLDQHTDTIEVSENIDIVVIETNLRYGGEQYFYVVENDIFLKFLATASSFNPEFRYGYYGVEYIDNDTFHIVYEYSNTEDIYLIFDIVDGKVSFSKTILVTK